MRSLLAAGDLATRTTTSSSSSSESETISSSSEESREDERVEREGERKGGDDGGEAFSASEAWRLRSLDAFLLADASETDCIACRMGVTGAASRTIDFLTRLLADFGDKGEARAAETVALLFFRLCEGVASTRRGVSPSSEEDSTSDRSDWSAILRARFRGDTVREGVLSSFEVLADAIEGAEEGRGLEA